MAEQRESPEETMLEKETFPNAAEQKRIDHVAQAVAERASRTEQNYGKDHGIVSK